MKQVVDFDKLWKNPDPAPKSHKSLDRPNMDSRPNDTRLQELYQKIVSKKTHFKTDVANSDEWAEYQDGKFIFNGTEANKQDRAGGWMMWNGSHWQRDVSGAVMQSVKEFTVWLWNRTLEDKPESYNESLKCIQQKTTSLGDVRKIENCLRCAASLPHLAYEEHRFDCHPDLINFRNGTYDLSTHEFRPHDKRDLLTKSLSWDYNPKQIDKPHFDTFMVETFKDNIELIDFVYQCLAMCISGRITEQRLQFWYGTGANGKSLLANTIMDMLSCYSLKLEFATLMDSPMNSDKAQQEKTRLRGIRMAVASEVGEQRYLNEQLIKDLTSNDKLTARKLYCNTFEFYPSHHLIIFGNHKPRIRGTDDGIKRRVLLIPFLYTVPREKQIATDTMMDRFRSEYPAIMNRLISVYRSIQENNGKFIHIPEIVKTETEEYFFEMDIMANWIKDCCVIDQSYITEAKIAFQSYDTFMRENGYKPLGRIMFLRQLQERIDSSNLNISIYTGRSNHKTICGLGVLPISGGSLEEVSIG